MMIKVKPWSPETICLLCFSLKLISSAPTTNSFEASNDFLSGATSWLNVTTPQPRNTESSRENVSVTLPSESTVTRLLKAINALNESLSPKSKLNETRQHTVIDQRPDEITHKPLHYFDTTHYLDKKHNYENNSQLLHLAFSEISNNSSFHTAENSVPDFDSTAHQYPSTHNSLKQSENDIPSSLWTNTSYFTSTEISQQPTSNDHTEVLHSSSISDDQTQPFETTYSDSYESAHYQDFSLSTVDGRANSDHQTDGQATEIFVHGSSESPYNNYEENKNSSPTQDHEDITATTTETNDNKNNLINERANVVFSDSSTTANSTITQSAQQAENHEMTAASEREPNVLVTEYTPWTTTKSDDYQYITNATLSSPEHRNGIDTVINDTPTSNDFSTSPPVLPDEDFTSTPYPSDQDITTKENEEQDSSTGSDNSATASGTVREHPSDYYQDLTSGANTVVAEIVSSLLQEPATISTIKDQESSASDPNSSNTTLTTSKDISQLLLVSQVNDTAENSLVEHTTLSAADVFVNTPLENLINASVITAMDLSTVASIINPQSSSRPTELEQVSYEANLASKIPNTSCIYNGQEYLNGQNIDQLDPCHFCVCVNGYLDCYWKNCPPPPEGCMELEFEGVCDRSLYLCPIPKQGEPLPFPVNSIPRIRRETNSTKMTCNILEVEYKVGELVGVASDPCMECRCAVDSLYCSPKCCFQPVESALDPAKNSRANDAVWQPILSNPLKHLRSEFQSQEKQYIRQK